MPKYTVTISRTHTIESSCEIEVVAKDEERAQEKAEERIDKALNAGNLDDTFDWEDSNDEDQFEYEVN